jgi:hypothetical protein
MKKRLSNYVDPMKTPSPETQTHPQPLEDGPSNP